MKKTKYTEAQIVSAIIQFETGTRVNEISRQMGISQATFFNWKKNCGSMGVLELSKLRQLEEENQQLKKLVRIVKLVSLSPTEMLMRWHRQTLELNTPKETFNSLLLNY